MGAMGANARCTSERQGWLKSENPTIMFEHNRRRTRIVSLTGQLDVTIVRIINSWFSLCGITCWVGGGYLEAEGTYLVKRGLTVRASCPGSAKLREKPQSALRWLICSSRNTNTPSKKRKQGMGHMKCSCSLQLIFPPTRGNLTQIPQICNGICERVWSLKRERRFIKVYSYYSTPRRLSSQDQYWTVNSCSDFRRRFS